MDWLRENVSLRPESAQHLILTAVRSGDVGIVQWLYENFELEVTGAVSTAALTGQWKVTQWFLENASPEDLADAPEYPRVFSDYPTEVGNLEMLKFVSGRGLVRDPVKVLEVAAEHGQLHIVTWPLEENEIPLVSGAFQRAANKGHLDVIKYLHEKRPDGCRESDLDPAARSGFMQVVQWLHEILIAAPCTPWIGLLATGTLR